MSIRGMLNDWAGKNLPLSDHDEVNDYRDLYNHQEEVIDCLCQYKMGISTEEISKLDPVNKSKTEPEIKSTDEKPFQKSLGSKSMKR